MYLAAKETSAVCDCPITLTKLFLPSKKRVLEVKKWVAAKYTLSPHYGQSLLNDCARLRNVDRAMQLRFAASVVEIRRCFHRA